MKLREFGEQIVPISPKAFENIKFIEYELAGSIIYNVHHMKRDNTAKRAYLDTHAENFAINKDNLYIQDIQ